VTASLGAVGILGGSFDPVHDGHLGLARDARALLGLAAVRWVPSGKPGHREAPRADAGDRLAMLRLALAGDAAFSLDDADALSDQPTYTVNTLARLRKELGPAQPLVFLMGTDQLMGLDRWREWKTLFELAHFGVARRPGYEVSGSLLPEAVAGELARRRAGAAELALSPAGRIALFDNPPRDVSSSGIRAALAAGGRPDDALPATVLGYIRSNGLYRNRNSNHPKRG
jgi:nicotinate-nucleotide adenylyltransferase